MSQNHHRCIIGSILLFVLFYGEAQHIYILCGYLSIEFITNITLVSMYRFANGQGSIRAGALNKFGSERVLTLSFTIILLVSTYFNNDYTWGIPWFVALMLVAAGMTRLCPMKMSFAYLGLKE